MWVLAQQLPVTFKPLWLTFLWPLLASRLQICLQHYIVTFWGSRDVIGHVSIGLAIYDHPFYPTRLSRYEVWRIIGSWPDLLGHVTSSVVHSDWTHNVCSVVKVRGSRGSQTPCFRYGPPYLKTRPTCLKYRPRCFERGPPYYPWLNLAMSDPWGRDRVGQLICNVIRSYPGRIGLTDRSLLAGGQLSLC